MKRMIKFTERVSPIHHRHTLIALQCLFWSAATFQEPSAPGGVTAPTDGVSPLVDTLALAVHEDAEVDEASRSSAEKAAPAAYMFHLTESGDSELRESVPSYQRLLEDAFTKGAQDLQVTLHHPWRVLRAQRREQRLLLWCSWCDAGPQYLVPCLGMTFPGHRLNMN